VDNFARGIKQKIKILKKEFKKSNFLACVTLRVPHKLAQMLANFIQPFGEL